MKWSEVAQSCPTLCDPMDCSLPGSSVHGILQARILEWVAISFSRVRKSKKQNNWWLHGYWNTVADNNKQGANLWSRKGITDILSLRGQTITLVTWGVCSQSSRGHRWSLKSKWPPQRRKYRASKSTGLRTNLVTCTMLKKKIKVWEDRRIYIMNDNDN